MGYKYKTTDGSDMFIVGFGATVDGVIESDVPIENPNLVLIAHPDAGAQPSTVPEHFTGAMSQQNPQIVDPNNVTPQPEPREAI